MKVVNHVYPKAEQFAALAQGGGSGPVSMLNLVRFRDRAQYADGRATDLSGREAYMLYGAKMRGIVEDAGGKIHYSGDVCGLVIGEVDDLWDAVAVVEYPSREVFQEIATSPKVQEIGVHREAGLAGQLLILTTEADFKPAR